MKRKTQSGQKSFTKAWKRTKEESGIENMLAAAGIQADEKLIKSVIRLNKKFGRYHTLDMLIDSEAFLKKCTDKREKNPVTDFLALWEGKEDGK